jgi:hypothetical protein
MTAFFMRKISSFLGRAASQMRKGCRPAIHCKLPPCFQQAFRCYQSRVIFDAENYFSSAPSRER